MLDKTQTVQSAYFKCYKNLDLKKKELYKEGYSLKWNVDPRRFNLKVDDLKGDEDLAKYFMLPEETLELKDKLKIYGFFNS